VSVGRFDKPSCAARRFGGPPQVGVGRSLDALNGCERRCHSLLRNHAVERDASGASVVSVPRAPSARSGSADLTRWHPHREPTTHTIGRSRCEPVNSTSQDTASSSRPDRREPAVDLGRRVCRQVRQPNLRAAQDELSFLGRDQPGGPAATRVGRQPARRHPLPFNSTGSQTHTILRRTGLVVEPPDDNTTRGCFNNTDQPATNSHARQSTSARTTDRVTLGLSPRAVVCVARPSDAEENLPTLVFRCD
jgi:hypothetical protein